MKLFFKIAFDRRRELKKVVCVCLLQQKISKGPSSPIGFFLRIWLIDNRA